MIYQNFILFTSLSPISTLDFVIIIQIFISSLNELATRNRFSRGPKKDTLNEYQLKVEFLAKVVTRLEAERVQQERVAAAKAAAESRKNSVTGSGGGGGASNGGTDMTDGTGVVPISPTSGLLTINTVYSMVLGILLFSG